MINENVFHFPLTSWPWKKLQLSRRRMLEKMPSVTQAKSDPDRFKFSLSSLDKPSCPVSDQGKEKPHGASSILENVNLVESNLACNKVNCVYFQLKYQVSQSLSKTRDKTCMSYSP